MENSQESFIHKLIDVLKNKDQLRIMRKSLTNYSYDNDSIFKEYIQAIEGKL